MKIFTTKMKSDKAKKDILGQINSSIKNLSHFNEQCAQYQTQKLFNRTKENFTGIPMTGSKMTRVKHQPESSESEYYRESSYKPSNESSIDDKATKRVSTKKSRGFTDKQIRKDGKNSQNQFTK